MNCISLNTVLLLHFAILCKPIYCVSDVEMIVNSHHGLQRTVGEKFFSVALDTAVVASHFKNFDMKNRRLIKLVKNLSPGYLRIGGNMADTLYFSENPNKTIKNDNVDLFSIDNACWYNETEGCFAGFPNFTMTGEEWIKINNFAKKVGAKILFDLNCLIRYSDGSWDPTNAIELILFSDKHNFNIDWQLGNEPNAFKHVFNYSVNATQLSKDFVLLRNILNNFPRYKNSVLVGPDTTRPQPDHKESMKYLRQFLQSSNNDQSILGAIGFHQYYLNGHIATLSEFIDPNTFSLLEEQIKIVNTIVKQTGYNNTPVWLTETSSAYGGGAPGLSNRFVGSFLWLDKLGVSAKLGVQTVIRQSVFKDNYALIDDDYNPTPDWWLSVLYNAFVGPEVLNCDFNTAQNLQTVRLYCHCAAASFNFRIPTVTIFGINISNTSATVTIKGIEKSPNDNSYGFVLTSAESSLTTKNVMLNGKLLELDENGDFPTFPQKIVDIDKPLVMPKYSLVFWMIPTKNVQVCIRPSLQIIR